MRAAAGAVVLAALLLPLVPGRAQEPNEKDLVQAVEQKLKSVADKAGPSVACVVVSRSDKYPRPAAQEHPGQLGGFNRADAASADLAKKLDLSDWNNVPDHGSAGGVVIDAGGLVLTTYFAVEGATKIYVHLPGGRETSLPPNSALLFYLQRLRDEAHRFAIGSHRTRRSMEMRANPLDEIEGVGPGRKKALLHAFGSARGVSRASVDDLVKVEGVNEALAQRVFNHFRK